MHLPTSFTAAIITLIPITSAWNLYAYEDINYKGEELNHITLTHSDPGDHSASAYHTSPHSYMYSAEFMLPHFNAVKQYIVTKLIVQTIVLISKLKYDSTYRGYYREKQGLFI